MHKRNWKSEFEYDAFGRRRVRQEYTWTGSSWQLSEDVRYVYDGMLVVQERDGNNLAKVSYTRGWDLSSSLQGAGGIGGLLARTDNGQLNANDPNAHAYYHADGNGNITCLVDTNGAIVAKYHYDPYGNLLGKAGPLADKNLYQFSSKEWHPNAGLYYYGLRYYEPNLQRWLNRDPIEEEGGINLYGFTINMPTSRFDPVGLYDYCQDLIDNRLLVAYSEHSGREEFGQYLFDNAHEFTMKGGEGFKENLTAGGQGGAVGRHIAAGAGLTVSSRRVLGPILTRGESVYDIGQGMFTRKTMAEAKAEARSNAASRKVGRAFLDHMFGNCGYKDDCASFEELKKRLYDILCD